MIVIERKLDGMFGDDGRGRTAHWGEPGDVGDAGNDA